MLFTLAEDGKRYGAWLEKLGCGLWGHTELNSVIVPKNFLIAILQSGDLACKVSRRVCHFTNVTLVQMNHS